VTVIAEQGATVPDVSRSSTLASARIGGRHRPMLPRWCYTAALAAALVALVMSPTGRDIEDVVQLERLAPKIERTQALSPETREIINRLIARQSVAGGSSDSSHQIRRKAAIDRVTSALQAKDIGSAAGSLMAP
jgi:hypothetical protein